MNDYKVLWYGNGGVGVVSKEYPNCASREEAIEQFTSDQGEHAAQTLIDAYKIEADNASCAGCLALANEIRQLRNGGQRSARCDRLLPRQALAR